MEFLKRFKYLYDKVKYLFFNAVFFLTITVPAYAASDPDIATGLNSVDGSTLAEKIISIATGAGALIGAVAVGAMIFTGFKLATSTTEQKRAESLTHLMWSLGAVGIVGLSLVIVGFVAKLVKG